MTSAGAGDVASASVTMVLTDMSVGVTALTTNLADASDGAFLLTLTVFDVPLGTSARRYWAYTFCEEDYCGYNISNNVLSLGFSHRHLEPRQDSSGRVAYTEDVSERFLFVKYIYIKISQGDMFNVYTQLPLDAFRRSFYYSSNTNTNAL